MQNLTSWSHLQSVALRVKLPLSKNVDFVYSLKYGKCFLFYLIKLFKIFNVFIFFVVLENILIRKLRFIEKSITSSTGNRQLQYTYQPKMSKTFKKFSLIHHSSVILTVGCFSVGQYHHKSHRVHLTMTKSCQVFSAACFCQYLSSAVEVFESTQRWLSFNPLTPGVD